jgi:hypothetical protein
VAWNNFAQLLSSTLIRLTDVNTAAKKWTINTRETARDVAGKLLDEKWSVADPENEEGKRDVMSLLGMSHA